MAGRRRGVVARAGRWSGTASILAAVLVAGAAGGASAGGTASMVKDINAGGSSDPYGPVRFGTRFLFGADTTDKVLDHLWRSNGSGGGTRLVRSPFPQDVQDMVVVGDTLYLNGETASKGYELWRSDGTEAGTRVVRDIWPGAEDGNPGDITRLGDIIVMVAGHPDSGRELWRSDGTKDGTRLIKDIRLDGGSEPRRMTSGLGFVWFSAVGTNGGRELFRTDGTKRGTKRVKDINPGPEGSDPDWFTVLGNRVYFAATTAEHGRELWRSDGTEAGTVRVKDIHDGSAGSDPSEIVRMGSSLYFSATDGEHGRELWRSDGQGFDTFRISDTNPSGHGSPYELTPLDGDLYFFASTNPANAQLFRTNGTLAGTELVKVVAMCVCFPSSLTRLGDLLLFSNNAGDGTGEELWRSDGTPGGTGLAADIRTDSGKHSSPQQMIVLDGVLYFSADDGSHGRELWRYVP